MTEKPYSVQTKPLPLDMLSEGPGGDCWYRIPSWQIEFVSEVLAGLDLRIHRGLGNEGIWTLTEASTGCRLYDGWQDEPEDTAEDMLGEFIAVYLPKLTRDMMEKSIAGAKEKIKGRLPNPFARPEAVPIGEVVGHELPGRAFVRWFDNGLRPVGMKVYAPPSPLGPKS